MKKIALFHHDFGIGGAERLILDIALALKNEGKKVVIFTSYFDKNRCFEDVHTHNVPVECIGSFIPNSIYGRFHLLMALIKMIFMFCYFIYSRQEFDMTITDGAGYIILPFFKLFGYPVLFYCHFPDQLLAKHDSLLKKLYRYPLDLLEELCTKNASIIAVNSEFTKKVLLDTFSSVAKKYRKNEDFVIVVYPCIKIGWWLRDFDQSSTSQSFDPFKWTFLSINRFERKKCIELAINAFAKLKSKVSENIFNQCGLVVMGGYDSRVVENIEYKRELEKLVSDMGLQDNIVFVLSPQDSIKKKFIKESIALLYTPINEHFGIVPLEAMVSGCPVIATNTGGPLETILEGKTGFLTDPVPDSFSNCMKYLIEHPEFKENMSVIGKEHVEKNFSDRKLQSQMSRIMTLI